MALHATGMTDPLPLALAAAVAVVALVGTFVVLWRREKRRGDAAEASELELHRLYGRLREEIEVRSAAEAERRSTRLKAALLEDVTHNLRIPITSLKASITALIGEPTRPGLPMAARLELLQVMNEEIDRLDQFVEELVAMARIDAGALALTKGPASVEDIMQAALARAFLRLGDRDLEVAAQSDLPMIHADPWAIEEAIFQLLDNAARYSPSKSVVRISASASRPHQTVEIRVEDQGPGIPEDDRERIFDKFFRGATVRTPGLGMGLSIARALVEAHGGTVSADNRTHNAGARLSIHLPIGGGTAE
jgi:two-component system sensor histidine kinase KdpD